MITVCWEEIIKELTATRNDDHITSGGVLACRPRKHRGAEGPSSSIKYIN